MQKLICLLTLVVVVLFLTNCSSFNEPIDVNDDVKYWTKATSPTIDDLRDIFFVNENVGWAVGSNSAIIKTNDGGKTWTKQTYSEFANFSDVYFLNENEGWICGTAGTLVHTTNGGITWTKLPIVSANGGFWGLSEVHFINENVGWIIGNSNGGVADVVVKTENGGKTWTIKLDKVPTQLNAIEVIDSTKIYISGGGFSSAAKLYYTSDAGVSWTETTIGQEEYSVSDIACKNSTIILVCPYMDSGYRSDNNGVSFSKDPNFSYSNRVTINDNIIWTSGSDQKISTDGGATWTITTEKNSDYVNNGDGFISFCSIGRKAWGASSDGKLFYYE